jgi:hypothetical protein
MGFLTIIFAGAFRFNGTDRVLLFAGALTDCVACSGWMCIRDLILFTKQHWRLDKDNHMQVCVKNNFLENTQATVICL